MIARRDNDPSGERLLAMSCNCASSGRCATCTAWAALARRLRLRAAAAAAPAPALLMPRRAARLRLAWVNPAPPRQPGGVR